MVLSLKNITANAALAMLVLFAACKKDPVDKPPAPVPIAKISAVQSITNRFEWTFEDSSTNTVSRHWDFGVDGVQEDTSTQTKVTYTYPQNGSFTVTLVVKSASGVEKTITKQIIIRASEKPTMSDIGVFSDNNSTNPNAPMLFYFSFTATSDNANIVEYTINYGDLSGSATTAVAEVTKSINPGISHTYTEAKEYTVTITVKNSDGQTVTKTATAHPIIINAIKITKVFLYHTPKDTYGPIDGFPDPYFNFYLNAIKEKFTSSTVDDVDCNHGMWAVWDVSASISNMGNGDYFYMDFYDDNLGVADELMGRTPTTNFDQLKERYPNKMIDLKDKPDDTGIGVRVFYEYIMSK